jgi:hypothetical protein
VPLEPWDVRTRVDISFNCKELAAAAPLLELCDAAHGCQNFTQAAVDGAWLNFTVRDASQPMGNGSYTARLFAGSVECRTTGELSAHGHSWTFVLVDAANTTVAARSPAGTVSGVSAGRWLRVPK